MNNKAVEPLIATMGDREGFVRTSAMLALEKMGSSVAELLIEALGHENREVRWRAAQTLGELGDSRASEALTRALQDEDNGVQITARQALL